MPDPPEDPGGEPLGPLLSVSSSRKNPSSSSSASNARSGRLRCDCPDPTALPQPGELLAACTSCGRLLHGSCLGLQAGDRPAPHFVCSNCSLQGFITRGSRHSSLFDAPTRGRPRSNNSSSSPPNDVSPSTVAPITTETPSAPEAVVSNGKVPSITPTASQVAINGVDDYPNTIANDASPLIRLLLGEYDQRLGHCPAADADGTFQSCNFEFCEDVVALPSLPVELGQLLGRSTDAHEIRSRGGQSRRAVVRRGLFVAEPGGVEIGQALCEFCGHIQRAHSIKNTKASTVPQTLVLFPGHFHAANRLVDRAEERFDLVVDARRHGDERRYVRRSCRPNAVCKAVLFQGRVHFFLFASKSLRFGDEVVLPLDWDYGNRLFRYECACHAPETCLAPEELLPEGYRETHMPPTTESFFDHPAPGSTVAQLSTSALTAPAEPPRKLTREERKLQRYIEAIERMEQAEKSKKTRSASHGSLGGPSGGSSPETARGPKRLKVRSASRIDVPKVPLKKRLSLATVPGSATSSSATTSTAQLLLEDLSLASSSTGPSAPPTPQVPDFGTKNALPEREDEVELVDVEAMDEVIDVVSASSPPSPRKDESAAASMTISPKDSDDSTKRMSLTDYLHRRQLSVPIDESKSSTTPSATSYSSPLAATKGYTSPTLARPSSPALSTSSSSSRESGEYIEPPSYAAPSSSVNADSSAPFHQRSSSAVSNASAPHSVSSSGSRHHSHRYSQHYPSHHHSHSSQREREQWWRENRQPRMTDPDNHMHSSCPHHDSHNRGDYHDERCRIPPSHQYGNSGSGYRHHNPHHSHHHQQRPNNGNSEGGPSSSSSFRNKYRNYR